MGSQRRHRRGSTTLAAGLLLAALSGGCSSTHTHTSFGLGVAGSMEEASIRVEHALPDDYRVLAVSVVTPEGKAVAPEDRSCNAAYPFPREVFEDHLVEMLERSGGFSQVIRLRGDDREELRKVAREAGAGLLLEMRLDRPQLAFLERTSGATWCLLIWIWAGWATHWWHDQIYEMDFAPHVRLTDLVSGRGVGEETLPAISSEQALSFHERSRGLWAYLLTVIWPPTWSSADPETVLENMLSASGPEVDRPVAELLNRMYLPEIIRIRLPEGKDLPVAFTFESPADGTPADEVKGLRMRLDLAGSLKDLVRVRLNEEVLWDASEKENIPPVKEIEFMREKLPLEKGKAEIEVTLRSAPKPIRAQIVRSREVKLKGRPSGS